MSEQLSAVLDELAARFGATGAELWRELVRYEIASAVMTTFVFVAVASGLSWAARRVWARYRDEGGEWDVGAFIVTIVAGGAWLGAAVALGNMAVVLSAPQAAVIRGLLP